MDLVWEFQYNMIQTNTHSLTRQQYEQQNNKIHGIQWNTQVTRQAHKQNFFTKSHMLVRLVSQLPYRWSHVISNLMNMNSIMYEIWT